MTFTLSPVADTAHNSSPGLTLILRNAMYASFLVIKALARRHSAIGGWHRCGRVGRRVVQRVAAVRPFQRSYEAFNFGNPARYTIDFRVALYEGRLTARTNGLDF